MDSGRRKLCGWRDWQRSPVLWAIVAALALSFSAAAQPSLDPESPLSPSSAAAYGPAFELTVTGEGFATDAVVIFGGAPLTPGTPATPESVTVTVPANLLETDPGDVQVIVRNPGDEPEDSGPATFTITAAPPPVTTAVDPVSVYAESGIQTITVSGTGFLTGATIEYGSDVITPATVTSTSITFNLDTAGIAFGGRLVYVNNPDGQVSNGSLLLVGEPIPIIAQVTPSSLDASVDPVLVTITGDKFRPSSKVWLGEELLTPISVTLTAIEVPIPASLLTVVRQDVISIENTPTITRGTAPVVVMPTVLAVSPDPVVANSGTFTLQVTGVGFVSGSTVLYLNGSPVGSMTVGGDGTTATVSVPASLIEHAGSRTLHVSVGGILSSPTAHTLEVSSAANLTITSDANLDSATVGAAKQWPPLQVAGGVQPYTWSMAPGSTLPSNLSLNAQTGILSGTPTLQGDYTFTIRATDSGTAPVTGDKTFTLSVGQFTVLTSGVPQARVGVLYNAVLEHVNGPTTNPADYTWILESGESSLPPGLSFSPSTGAISGIPESVGGTVETFNIQVLARHNPTGLQTPVRTITIGVSGGGLDITVQSLPVGAVGQAYGPSGNGITIQAVNGTAPYTIDFTPTSLAVLNTIGLEADRPNATTPASVASLRLRGTPAIGGEFVVEVVVRDGVGSQVQRDLPLVILGSELSISPAELPSAIVNVPYEQQLTLTGLTAEEQPGEGGQPGITWQLINAPPPLSLSVAGRLSGTFSATGSHVFSVTAVTALRSVTQQFTLQVGESRPEIITTSLPAATIGSPYAATIEASGGTPGYTWQIAGIVLPAGLSFVAESVTSNTLRITGTPSPGAESRTFTLSVRDATGQSGSREFTLGVSAVPLPELTMQPFENPQPAEQKEVRITLAQPYPLALSGTATVSFQPDATNNTDDPNVRFLSGSRTATFVIQANTTEAVFPNVSPQRVQTGTVAGTIRVEASIDGAAASTAQEFTIARGVPVILEGASVQNTTSGFTLTLTGYSTPRDLSNAQVNFVAAPGSNLQTIQVTVPLSTQATEWFNGTAGQANGSAFRLTIPFTVQGGSNAVQSLSVTLSNSAGTSAARSVSF